MLSNVEKVAFFCIDIVLYVHTNVRGIGQTVLWWFYCLALSSRSVEILTLSENRLFFQVQKRCSNFYESEAYPGPKDYTKR